MRFLLAAALVLWSTSAGSQEDPRKEYLRLQYTEFCSAVKMPPKSLVDAINSSLPNDMKTWMPVVEWMNRIIRKYEEAGCGDA